MRAATIVFMVGVGMALAAPRAHADRGEVAFDASLGADAALLLHPAVHDALASPASATATFTVLPRVGLGGRYGLTDELWLGVAGEVGAAPALKAPQVHVKNTTGDLLTGTYAELAVPLSLAWRLDSGHDVSGAVELAAGPLMSVWEGNALADPARPDANGLPSALPVKIDDAWNLGAMLRVGASLEVRLFDVLVVEVEPSAAVSWAGTLGVRGGVVIAPSFVRGIGPL